MAEEPHLRLAPPRRFPSLPSLVLCAVILACGMVIGGVGAHVVFREPERFGPPPPGEMPEKITGHLRGDLGLSDAQASQVKEVLLRSEEEMDRIRLKVAPEMDAQFDKVEVEISGLLEPGQLDAWHKKCEEMRRRVHFRRPADGNP